MRPDIVNLRQFYSSRLGRKVKRQLRRIANEYWKDEQGLHTLGIGYATPLMRPPASDSNPARARVVALMPIAQGAIYWPVDDANHSILGDEMRPPFPPSSIHRIVMLHAFEYAQAPDELLRVMWQLLAPGGRMLLVVPSRRGLWARLGATPFSTGTPYTLGALKELLRGADFTLRDARSTLFTPPSTHAFWLRAFSPLEWLGNACFPRIGGVFVIEAEKQIYAGIRPPALSVKAARQWVPASASALSTPSISQNSHTAGSSPS
ncbi:MAG: methyltransferase domain-containing protein [Pseudomonadota bacterium]